MCIAEEKMSAGLAELGTNTHAHCIGNTIFIHLVIVMECQEGNSDSSLIPRAFLVCFRSYPETIHVE